MVVKVLPKAQDKETPKLSPGFWYPRCLFNPARENMKLRLPTFILWISEHWATLTSSIFLRHPVALSAVAGTTEQQVPHFHAVPFYPHRPSLENKPKGQCMHFCN